MFDVCKTGDLKVGEKRAFKVAGEHILLFHLNDGFYATQARCTHLFKSMENGEITANEEIQCPLHRARFDIKTGEVNEWANFPKAVKVIDGIRPAKCLKTYPVIIEGDAVKVLVGEEPASA